MDGVPPLPHALVWDIIARAGRCAPFSRAVLAAGTAADVSRWRLACVGHASAWDLALEGRDLPPGRLVAGLRAFVQAEAAGVARPGRWGAVLELVAADDRVDAVLEVMPLADDASRARALERAAALGHARVVRAMVRAGVRPTGSAVVMAAASGDLAAVEPLLVGGAVASDDPVALSAALHVARCDGRDDVVQALVAAGAVLGPLAEDAIVAELTRAVDACDDLAFERLLERASDEALAAALQHALRVGNADACRAIAARMPDVV